MRKIVTPQTQPKEGDARTKSGFLLLPKKIGNEWRWLEYASWKQVCIKRHSLVPERGYSPGQYHLTWASTEWG